jgi:molybdopterin converting factor small subunit
MPRVRTEFWMWLGKDLGPDFVSPTDMRASLQTEVQEGTTVEALLEQIAGRYPVVREKLFTDGQLSQYVVATLNYKGMNREELLARELGDGDILTVLPIYVGG